MKYSVLVLGLLATFGFAGSALAQGAGGGLLNADSASDSAVREALGTAHTSSDGHSSFGVRTGAVHSSDAEGPDRLGRIVGPIGGLESNSGQESGSQTFGR